MFTTSVNPEQIVANLQIEVFTAWEFIPPPRTCAHLARTPAVQAADVNHQRTVPQGKKGTLAAAISDALDGAANAAGHAYSAYRKVARFLPNAVGNHQYGFVSRLSEFCDH